MYRVITCTVHVHFAVMPSPFSNHSTGLTIWLHTYWWLSSGSKAMMATTANLLSAVWETQNYRVDPHFCGTTHLRFCGAGQLTCWNCISFKIFWVLPQLTTSVPYGHSKQQLRTLPVLSIHADHEREPGMAQMTRAKQRGTHTMTWMQNDLKCHHCCATLPFSAATGWHVFVIL